MERNRVDRRNIGEDFSLLTVKIVHGLVQREKYIEFQAGERLKCKKLASKHGKNASNVSLGFVSNITK